MTLQLHHVNYFLFIIKLIFLDSKLLSSLTKILPFLTGNQEEACRVLIRFFSPYLNFSTMAADPKQNQDAVRDYYMGKFIEMTEMLPASFNIFRGILVEEKLIEKIINFIQELCPDVVNFFPDN